MGVSEHSGYTTLFMAIFNRDDDEPMAGWNGWNGAAENPVVRRERSPEQGGIQLFPAKLPARATNGVSQSHGIHPSRLSPKLICTAERFKSEIYQPLPAKLHSFHEGFPNFFFEQTHEGLPIHDYDSEGYNAFDADDVHMMLRMMTIVTIILLILFILIIILLFLLHIITSVLIISSSAATSSYSSYSSWCRHHCTVLILIMFVTSRSYTCMCVQSVSGL